MTGLQRISAFLAAALILRGAPAFAATRPLPPDSDPVGEVRSLALRYRVTDDALKPLQTGRPVTRETVATALAPVARRMLSFGDDRLPARDRDRLEALLYEFEPDLSRPADPVLSSLTDVTGALPEVIHGRIQVGLVEDPEDKLPTFSPANGFLSFDGRVSPWMRLHARLGAAVGFGVGSQSGPPLAALGLSSGTGQFAPVGEVGLLLRRSADAWTAVRAGQNALGTLLAPRSYAGHWKDGLLAPGLVEPVAAFRRPFANDGVALAQRWGWLSSGVGISALDMACFLGLHAWASDLTFFLDAEHDFFRPPSTTPRAHPLGLGAALNLGSERLGLNIQGGGRATDSDPTFAPSAGLQVVTDLWGIELAGGASYRTGPGASNPPQEVIPTGYAYLPAYGPWLPWVLIGMNDVRTVGGKSVGPGSLLGSLSGWTFKTGLAPAGWPTLSFEFGYLQEVLLNDIYHGYASAVSLGYEF